MKKLIPLLLSIFFFGAILAFSYDDPLDNLLAQLAKMTGEYPQEKIHLQFDKPFYSLGEDVWFKAYLVNVDHNILSSRSKIIYVDLLDDRDSVRKTLLLPLINGTASGDIHLSDSILTAGNYHVYAYTKWMTNFGAEYFFKKNITVINALRGNILASIQYKVAETTNGKQLNTDLTYRDDNGNAYNNQPVSYTLQAGGKTILNGKAVTNASGSITISTLIKSEYKDANIQVNTTVKSSKPGTQGHNIAQDFVIKPLANVADIQFFPEGGHLVSGIRTKVAFKALKPEGLGENISGYITDDSNEHLAEFKSEHAGMGIFALQPLTGKTYTAVITHQDGSQKRYPLPKVDESGYVLNINHAGKDSLSVRISASAGLVDGKEVALVAQCNGVVQFAAKIKIDRASNLSYVSSKKYPAGITQFTLFSPDYKPMAERLIFIDHNDQLSVDLKTDQTTYTKRGKVKMDITVTNALGEPVVGTFSVAVTDAGKVKTTEDNETSILSNLLLTSDIKGYIEQPNYYFNPENSDRQKHLDELLLTQGWCIFSWADLQAGKFPLVKYQPEQSLTISGTVTNLGDKPVSKGRVTLFAKTANGPLLVDTTADENGRYVFSDLYFLDSTKLVIRSANAKNRNNVKTTIDKKPHIQYNSLFDAAGNAMDMSLNEYLKYTQERFDEMGKYGLINNVIALKEVNITGKKNYFADHTIPGSANLSPGMADQVIKPAKLETEANLLYAFYGLAGIEVKNNMVYRVGRVTSLTRPQGVPMEVLLDGAIIDPSDLQFISPGDLAGVELLTSGANTSIYGNEGVFGVILLTTKRGTGLSGLSNAINVAHFTPQGYSSVRQFYSPAYDTPVQSKMADLRSTIYWNPDIITDAQGKASVSYFNADGTGTYKVVLEGLDLKGKLARQIYTYVVK